MFGMLSLKKMVEENYDSVAPLIISPFKYLEVFYLYSSSRVQDTEFRLYKY